jgi:hypothetical protein
MESTNTKIRAKEQTTVAAGRIRSWKVLELAPGGRKGSYYDAPTGCAS